MKIEDYINFLIAEMGTKKVINTSLISDGYHSFGELYEHRIVLYITLCKIIAVSSYREDHGIEENPVWKSKYHSDGELIFDGKWFILGIFRNKKAQITYHLPIDRWNNVPFAEELNKAPDFDGHTPKDVLKRIKNL